MSIIEGNILQISLLNIFSVFRCFCTMHYAQFSTKCCLKVSLYEWNGWVIYIVFIRKSLGTKIHTSCNI